MNLKKISESYPQWIDGRGPKSDIVYSSRLRLARNLEGIPFPHYAKRTELEKVFHLVEKAVKASPFLKNADIINLNESSALERQFFLERHLISVEHARKEDKPKYLVIGDGEIVSIMINEEDHLRLQAICSGLQIAQAWQILSQIDDDLERNLPYAFHADFGYLTSCPTNTGTGMRASALIHLPGLVKSNQINNLLKAISQLGLAARGLYGEGTKSRACFFQISNQVTLGLSEEEILQSIEKICYQITNQESRAESLLMSEKGERIKDAIGRAYGTLKNSYILSSQEAMELLSEVRWGVRMQILPNIDLAMLNALFLLIGPAHLQLREEGKMDALMRDVRRATLIRDKL